MTNSQCEICGKEELIPFKCKYCGGFFCAEHRLPENHYCAGQPTEAPVFARPKTKKYKPSKNAWSFTPSRKQKNKSKLIKIVAVVIVISLSLFIIDSYVYPIFQLLQNSGEPNQNTPNIPLITTPYVQVDYETVGWFYSLPSSAIYSNEYNYTYLVLNVTIVNHGYSQVNIIRGCAFSVLINDKEYPVMIIGTGGRYFNGSKGVLGSEKQYSFSPSLPNQAILLDGGSVNGIICFPFGDPKVIPQQPQILKVPFKLQYSVSYGDSIPLVNRVVLWTIYGQTKGPYAKVVINQIE